jgi:hypothetical protein
MNFLFNNRGCAVAVKAPLRMIHAVIYNAKINRPTLGPPSNIGQSGTSLELRGLRKWRTIFAERAELPNNNLMLIWFVG